jgi:hypothetical protein
MTVSNQIFLVMDAGSPKAAFTTKDEMKAYLKRRRGTLNRSLVYKIDGEGHAPARTCHHDFGEGDGRMTLPPYSGCRGARLRVYGRTCIRSRHH